MFFLVTRAFKSTTNSYGTAISVAVLTSINGAFVECSSSIVPVGSSLVLSACVLMFNSPPTHLLQLNTNICGNNFVTFNSSNENL